MEYINPDDSLSGSLCVADTNILLYAEQGHSSQCQRLLKRCAHGEVLIVMPQTVWHEVGHKLMLAEALMKGKVTGPNPAARLSRTPEVVKQLDLYRQKIMALKNLGLGYEPCTLEDYLQTTFLLQKKYGLLTNDSIILATALRLRADVLVTADDGFREVIEIPVSSPSDLTPRMQRR